MFKEWGQGLLAPRYVGSDEDDLEWALAADRAALRTRVHAAVQRPEVREALYLASPDFCAALARWEADPEANWDPKIERALTQYFSRLTGRSTPFGLFAAGSVGRIADVTRLADIGIGALGRSSRLDMEYVAALSRRLIREPAVLRRVILRPNSALYPAAGRWHLIECRDGDAGRSYHLVSLDDTPYLREVLDAATGGSTFHAVARHLCDVWSDVALEESREYVRELVESQVLITDLEPAATGGDALEELIDKLDGLKKVSGIRATLSAVRDALRRIDCDGVGIDCARYDVLATRLETLPTKVDRSRLLQVDMKRETSNAVLGPAVVQEILAGAELLREISPQEDPLRGFREAFLERFDRQELSLLEALDEEVGVGFPDSGTESAAYQAPLNARWSFLLNKVAELRAAGQLEWRLTEGDLERLRAQPDFPLPDAFHANVTVCARSDEAVDRGDFVILWNGGMGPAGANMMGRFCHVDDALHGCVVEHLRAEEATRPDVIHAEVAHLPEARLGNVVHRPVLREYEIPVVSRSGAAPERQIPLSELRVSIVCQDRIVLRSARLGREVIPRMTNAHNFATRQNLPIYRFLCWLQMQGRLRWLGWNWGAASAQPFLPRVTYGRIILSRARWRVDAALAKRLDRINTDAGRYRAIQDWRERNEVPRQMALLESDRELRLDLDAAPCVDVLVHLVRNRSVVDLAEAVPAFGESPVRQGDAEFVQELVVPFVRRSDGVEPRLEPRPHGDARGLPAPTPETAVAVRRFPPGSEWQFLKLYTGWGTADRILCDRVRPLVETLASLGVLERWFFVRYADPHPHLRLRFRATDGNRGRLRDLLDEAAAQLLSDGLAWSVQFDTYQREVERYGGPAGIELSEHVFRADSELVLRILSSYRGDAGISARELLGLRGLHDLLEDFEIRLEERIRIVTWSVSAATDEHRRWRARYREERAQIEAVLGEGAADATGPLPLGSGLAALRWRSAALRPFIAPIRNALEDSASAALGSVMLSYMHMHLNRLFRSDQRAYESWAYTALDRYYRSLLGRLGKKV